MKYKPVCIACHIIFVGCTPITWISKLFLSITPITILSNMCMTGHFKGKLYKYYWGLFTLNGFGCHRSFHISPTLESEWDLLLRYLRLNRIVKTFLYDFCVNMSSSKCIGQGLAQGWTAEDFVYAAEMSGEGSKHLQELQEIISDK